MKLLYLHNVYSFGFNYIDKLLYAINGGMLGCFVWQVAMSVTPACKCDLLIKKGN